MAHLPTRTARRLLAALIRDRKGATAIEYGLILAMIVLALIAALAALGGSNGSIWGNIQTKVTESTGN